MEKGSGARGSLGYRRGEYSEEVARSNASNAGDSEPSNLKNGGRWVIHSRQEPDKLKAF